VTTIEIRPIESGDADVMARAFSKIGWSKPVSLFQRYVREQLTGR
jgi:hypothetical protein